MNDDYKNICNKVFTYDGYGNGFGEPFEINDTFNWDHFSKFKVEDVDSDETGVTIYYSETYAIRIEWTGSDKREEDKIDFKECKRSSDGCCKDHYGCGYDLCDECYPFQRITMKCEIKLLIGQKIKKFVAETDDYYPTTHEFVFICENGTKVPFELDNTNPNHDVNLVMMVY
ncbi:MAG: hypothetical protein Satyrvirus8_22 [Satyrvirus sp.]|uniref:Uncharacterized protein n=1 Tax=Satyrvirus sp. TaxID=2487771 RepID=A0A3G5AFA4_9VIRU|nr:MAG: hypothetical protein Satyrvirus8_22 [Satyrvirus sp.]